ncbi:MAG TPA: M48 family metallopeptidase [Candidatus Saccharimonadales bacterium]|nr:M48 family metallopeptidase [Candidatus Saccharimonadales bacterium]
MYSEIAANKRKTWLIILLFGVIIAALGWIISTYTGKPSFLYLALIVGSVYALIQYFLASKLALAMNGAKQIEKKDNPRLYRTVENLAISTGMPMPKVYIIDDPAPNAFATGRDPDHAVVAATTGLLEIMDDSELEAVMAHELGHVKNYDIRVMMIVFGLVSAIGFIADMIFHFMWFGGDDEDSSPNPLFIVLMIAAAILAPLVATLVQLAVSRRREYLADSTGALTTRYPEGLANALEKIRDHGSVMQKQNTATAHFFFANPLKGKSLAKLFSTHPPIDDRIARLRDMNSHL